MRIIFIILAISLLGGCSKSDDVKDNTLRLVFDTSSYPGTVIIRQSYEGGYFSTSSPEFTGLWERELEYRKGDNLSLTLQVDDLNPKNVSIKVFVGGVQQKLAIKSEIIQDQTYYTTQIIL